jgi:hypothetical protein
MRPNVNLDYLVMKVERAKAHLDALNPEIDAYAKDSHVITKRDDIINGRSIRRTQWKAMPPIIGMLLGEFLYCLRSGLDQLMWQLALPSARKDRAKEICFPVFESISNPKKEKHFRLVLKLFPDEVAQIVENLQPFQLKSSAKDHPLWILHELCNLDKHRVIPINSRILELFVPNHPAVRMDHFEAEDAIEISVPILDKHLLDFKTDPVMKIEFGEWDSDLQVPRQKLGEIHEYFVITVIPTFEKFISKPVAAPELRLVPGRAVYQK